ncbi:MAG TPA: AAA family ATPase [Thermoanaerobaculia bacterium]|nr:AAA family ATPase [Thermoanaerobaculia bacterium]
MILRPIDAKAARRRSDLSSADFETTTELAVLTESIGQPRAVEALKLGVGIDQDGYNIFVLGEPATGRHALAESFLRPVAAARPTPPDWCYVHNFEDARKPKLLALSAGLGNRLRRDLEKFAVELRTVLATALESDEYQTRRQILDEEYKTLQETQLGEAEEEARKRGLALLRTPMGVAFAPMKGDEIAPPEEFHKLSEEDRKRIQRDVEELQERLRKSLEQAPRWERERQERLRRLNHEVVGTVIHPLIEELKSGYAEHSSVVVYLEAVREDVIEKHGEILQAPVPPSAGPQRMADLALRRYHVNVVVDNGATAGAPVVYENNPTYGNLVGRVEHVAREGMLTTDFTLIKAGSLHRANGGYLILDARRLLLQPFAYDALKRALQSGQVRIESPVEAFSLITTISLEPEPLPLDVKVVLIGEPLLYYLLTRYDPDFAELFKIPADLDPQLDRGDGNEALYARLVATLVKERGLKPFDRSAVECVLEESARMAGDALKLSSKVEEVADLLRESDYWTGQRGAVVVTRDDVERAVEARVFRLDRLRERIQEMILRDLLYIDTDGQRVGQINGLSVLALGNFLFGRPSRITARVQVGNGRVLNIEREVELSGPIHSKGVLILAAFLGGRYARERPLSVNASLVFEQSYGGVDGDSASSTELYALLSELAEIPIDQSLAVTGSVNQHGIVQPIGGVNEKIEGFFDLCRSRGLTGRQGVLIPQSNVQHLMLRRDVVAAIDAGSFRVYPIERIDQGIELLTGVPAGEPDADGRYPEGSVNRRVLDRLEELSEKARAYGTQPPPEAPPRVSQPQPPPPHPPHPPQPPQPPQPPSPPGEPPREPPKEAAGR